MKKSIEEIKSTRLWQSGLAVVSGLLLQVSVSAQAATISASDCSQSSVQAAINSAAVNDIVSVPAGSCTWSSLNINKAVHVKGAGIGQSRINLGGESSISKQSAGVVRVSGFSFTKSGGGNASKGFRIGGSWKNAQPVVIEGNDFNISGTGLIETNTAGGVIIAGNSFTGAWDDSFLQLKDDGDSEGSWSTADSIGSRDTSGKLNTYVEDNTFYGGTNQGIDADDASRVVYRYNTLTYSSFNSHGRDTSPIGVRHFEIYNNNFKYPGGSTQLANQNWQIWIRGGTGVIYNNQITDITGYWGNKTEIKFSFRGAEDVRPQGACSNVRYPVPAQIGQNHNGTSSFTDPLYLWGNTGAVNFGIGWDWGNPCGFDINTFFQWNRDAVNGASAKPGYAAYAYPHPLRAGGSLPPPPPANVGPSVSITSPSSGASFSAGSNIAINASASDSDGSVSKVEFFSGSTKLGEDLTSPYSFTMVSAAAGSYSLIARATDNAGAVANSAVVNITVNAVTPPPPANVAPSVSITSPASGSSFSAGASIAINANASDSDGSVAKVEFFNGSVKLGEDLTAPYSYTMVSAAAGSYSLVARATDNVGAVTNSAAVSITVNAVAPPPANVGPTVSITSPSSGSSFSAGMSIAINASASDSDGSVSKVEFFNGSTKLGEDLTAPYSFTMASAVEGSYSLIARATDNAGAVANSAAVSITVNAVAPPPPSGTSQTLLTSQVPAQMNLNDGVSYELGMRFTSTAAGKITGIRFFKASSESGTHTGKIYSSSGALLASVVFSAETASGWQQMSLASPLSIAANTEYTVSVNTGAGYYVATNLGMASQISNGVLRSVVGNNGVYGSIGSRPTSSYESSNYFRDIVFVADSGSTPPPPPPPSDVSAPVASITSPVNGATVTVNTTIAIQASASDDIEVTKVEFYVNGALKCTDTSAPYSCNWLVPKRTGRTHSLQVKAYDASGKSGSSAIVKVTSK
ncbi:MAG: Ig-like domain-containing protein [Pseudobdellovibrionaceae bacterium]